MKKLILSLILGTNIAIILFSIMITVSTDTSSTPFVSSFAIFLLIIAISFRWITADNAKEGFQYIVLSLIPGIINWGLKSKLKFIVLTFTVSLISFYSYKLGPQSIHHITINNGDAHYININGKHISTPTKNKWISINSWQPFSTKKQLNKNITCLNTNKKEWIPNYQEEVIECGKGYYPNLIVNGIKSDFIDHNSSIGQRIIERKNSLRLRLKNSLPPRNINDALLIATWNVNKLLRVRNNGTSKSLESCIYIAEIISHFDIIAIQEVNRELSEILKIKELLGEQYGLVYSLVAPGFKGNNERLAFFYDKRKIQLGKLAGNVVIPESLFKDRVKERKKVQLSRVPFIATFNFFDNQIALCNTHIYFGSNTDKTKRQERIEEIKRITNYLIKIKNSESNWKGALGLIGDLNIPEPRSPEIEALLESGFNVDKGCSELGTSVMTNKPYDQIAFIDLENLQIGRYGVIDFLQDIYRDEDESQYWAEMKTSLGYSSQVENKKSNDLSYNRTKFYKRWRTMEISDHFPKWIEIKDVSKATSLQTLRK